MYLPTYVLSLLSSYLPAVREFLFFILFYLKMYLIFLLLSIHTLK